MSKPHWPVVAWIGLLTAGTAWAQDTTPLPPQPQALHFYAVDPCRVFDARDADDPIVTTTLNPIGSQGVKRVVVRGTCGIPADAQAIAYNLTVIGTFNALPYPGHTLVHRANFIGGSKASSSNFPPNFTIANAAIVSLSTCPRYETEDDTQRPCPAIRGDIAVNAVLGGGAPLGTRVYFAVDVTGYFK
jgi:hypothetical protein